MNPTPMGVALQRVGSLLSGYGGTQVRFVRAEPVQEGWSAQFGAYPWLTRCYLEDASGALPRSAIVKGLRPDGHWRGERDHLPRERAALKFLTSLGSLSGPRLLAYDDAAGVIVMEDLGPGPALEDLLVGTDAAAAERGLLAFARALGQLHATTVGQAAAYYRLRSKLGPIDPAVDRTTILRVPIRQAWEQVRGIAAELLSLPHSSGVGADIDELLREVAEPGPSLAFSNGDTSPANCRLTESGVRFLDFEEAAFRHALLDAAALRFPFPACACWSPLPEDVQRSAEAAYREEFGHVCPDVLDPDRYERGMTAACAAWTLVRMVRIPKLDNADAPQPLGFSRRGQLLDTIDVTVRSARQSRRLPALASWLDQVQGALRARWPEVSSRQPVYPAFRA